MTHVDLLRAAVYWKVKTLSMTRLWYQLQNWILKVHFENSLVEQDLEKFESLNCSSGKHRSVWLQSKEVFKDTRFVWKHKEDVTWTQLD